MPQILVTKPGALSLDDRSALRRDDIVIVETDNPADVKLLGPGGAEIGASGLLFAALRACPEKPTHVCVVCAARWINNPDGSWSLATAECGPCCDNVPMDKAPIVKLLPEGYPDGQEYKRVRGAYDQAQRDALVARYGGIICTLCGEPFEQHYRNWRCSKRIAPRFTFPAESTDRTQLDELRAENERLRKALEPFVRGPAGRSLAMLYAHLTREHYRNARKALGGTNG